METISYDYFSHLHIKIGEVISAERIAGSEKLLKLSVDLGEGKRQIVAGIGKKYEPEFLIGKQVLVLANLEPRALMGFMSEGMLLAGDGVDGPVLLVPVEKVSPGSLVK